MSIKTIAIVLSLFSACSSMWYSINEDKYLPVEESNPTIDSIKTEFLKRFRTKENCYVLNELSFSPHENPDSITLPQFTYPIKKIKFGRIIHTPDYDTVLIPASWCIEYVDKYYPTKRLPPKKKAEGNDSVIISDGTLVRDTSAIIITEIQYSTRGSFFGMMKENSKWEFFCKTHSFGDGYDAVEEQIKSMNETIIAMYYKDDDGKEDPTFWWRLFNYDKTSTAGREKNEKYSKMIQENGKDYFINFLEEQKKEMKKRDEENDKRRKEKYERDYGTGK